MKMLITILIHTTQFHPWIMIRATRNSSFEGDKFPVLFWKNPENSRFELMTYLQANTLNIARKWPKLLKSFLPTAQNSIVIARIIKAA